MSSDIISFNNITPIIAGSLPLIVSIAGIFKFDTWSQVAFYIGIHVIFIGIMFFGNYYSHQIDGLETLKALVFLMRSFKEDLAAFETRRGRQRRTSTKPSC